MSKEVTIIAEMACSNDGSVDLAKKIIDAAGEAKSREQRDREKCLGAGYADARLKTDRTGRRRPP